MRLMDGTNFNKNVKDYFFVLFATARRKAGYFNPVFSFAPYPSFYDHRWSVSICTVIIIKTFIIPHFFYPLVYVLILSLPNRK